ncbi:FAD-binding oxidoreductase [Micromonospora carbonacea]|uniref:FAD-binding oxidoreductase n=1 Tax=Micromonospora carbonacea TaxID=47853 RepID=UPI00371FE25A
MHTHLASAHGQPPLIDTEGGAATRLKPNGLHASWTTLTPRIHHASNYFWCLLADRGMRLLPERDAQLFLATVGHLIAGGDNHAGRTALLAAFAPTYRHLGLQPYHHQTLVDALTATVARHAPTTWTSTIAEQWRRHGHHVLNLTHRAAHRLTTTHPWTPAQIIDRDPATDTTTVLTLRPRRRLHYEPGQALPVTTLHRPGAWRWYSPANAPRPDGTIELHVRAVPDGPVSPCLTHLAAVGEYVWLGPPYHAGLTLDPDHHGDLLLAGGGTGLAPLRAIVEHLTATGATNGRQRRVTLIVGARTLEDLYDSITLDTLQTTHHEWLTIRPTFTDDPLVDPAAQGDVLTAVLDHYRPGHHVHVAGPPALIDHARHRLPLAGIPANHLHLAETFTRPTSPAVEPTGGTRFSRRQDTTTRRKAAPLR